MGNAPKIEYRDCRLIVDDAARGTWNMALDESLLQFAPNQKRWTLRFYQWSRPTLSLGYFQSHAGRSAHAASRAADLVRRSTGGGAILHDAELTYSITLPAAETSRGHSDWLYYALHETLIDALVEFGVRAGLQPRNRPDPDADEFLCFRRRTRGDVLLAAAPGAHAWKIAGSAQRRSKGAVL
ncbi:MAG: lipoate--protein ligase family protein, partial [Pirellulales bacterium]